MRTETEKWEGVVEYFFKYQAINHFPEDRDSLIEKLKPVLDQYIQIAREARDREITRIIQQYKEDCKEDPLQYPNEHFMKLINTQVDSTIDQIINLINSLNNNK